MLKIPNDQAIHSILKSTGEREREVTAPLVEAVP